MAETKTKAAVKAVVAKVPAVKKFSEDNDRIYFTAVLANLPKERYKNDYAARAYAEITRTVTEDDGKKKQRQKLYTVRVKSTVRYIGLQKRL